MPDDLERQLQAFGKTLSDAVGEPTTPNLSNVAPLRRVPPRWWAMGGAAACLVAVVVGLTLVSRDDPAVQPGAVPSSTTTSSGSFAPFGLATTPLADLVNGCDPDDLVVSREGEGVEASYDEAVAAASQIMASHTPPGFTSLPSEGWSEMTDGSLTVRYLDRGNGLEAVVRIVDQGDGWSVMELGNCIPGLGDVTAAETTTSAASDGAVPDDPLGLERDGWSLVQRDTGAFEFSADELPCPEAAELASFSGVAEVHDILTPPDSTGLDLDIQVLDVGSIDRGNVLADAVLMIGRCLGESEGMQVETGALSSIRASWFRGGPDFALVTIVGDGSRSVVLEIENDEFSDDLIAELAQRADEFLRTGEQASRRPGPDLSPTFDVAEGAPVGTVQRDPIPGELLLWVGNQSFEHDPATIEIRIDGAPVVADEFLVEGQHNWLSWFVAGLSPGDHTVTATADSGATFSGTLAVGDGEPAWAVIDHWFEAGDDQGVFTFRQSDEPIAFE